MYISRSDIPSNSRTIAEHSLKAYHVVSFRRDFLIKFSELETTPLEKIEFNEYLRILVGSDVVSVDTYEDFEK